MVVGFGTVVDFQIVVVSCDAVVGLHIVVVGSDKVAVDQVMGVVVLAALAADQESLLLCLV